MVIPLQFSLFSLAVRPSTDGLVIRATRFASIKHSTQRRKDAAATPYINHPISVMDLLWREARVRHAPTLAAAVLHDTLEVRAVQ